MAWNEPGGGDRNPWNNKGGDQGPPDLDEVVRKLQEKFGGLFGGRRGGGGGGGGGDGGDGEQPSAPGGGKGVSMGLTAVIGLIVVVFLFFQSFYIIQPAERGVVKRFGAYNAVTGPGPHLKLPFIDSVDAVNVDQVLKFVHRAQMLTKGENIADVTLEVQYRIQDPADYLFQDADPKTTIHGSLESALREVIGKSQLDDIITDNRSGIAIAVMKGTQDLQELYRTGLVVTNVNIQRADVPEAVQDAFADAVKSREDKERMQNQAQTYANDVIPRARGAAARQIEDAKAYKVKVIAEADGESQRFLALLKEYEKAPGVTRERLYLETMEDVLMRTGKVLLDVKEGSNLTYLPLDRMIRQGVPDTTGSGALSPMPAQSIQSAPSPGDSRSRYNRSRGER